MQQEQQRTPGARSLAELAIRPIAVVPDRLATLVDDELRRLVGPVANADDPDDVVARLEPFLEVAKRVELFTLLKEADDLRADVVALDVDAVGVEGPLEQVDLEASLLQRIDDAVAAPSRGYCRHFVVLERIVYLSHGAVMPHQARTKHARCGFVFPVASKMRAGEPQRHVVCVMLDPIKVAPSGCRVDSRDMDETATDVIALEELGQLVPGPKLSDVRSEGSGSFASAFDVDQAVMTSAAAANAVFGVDTLALDRVVAMCAGSALVNGKPVQVWADLSGYYDTADGGHMQFHCNFPHHAAGVIMELGCEPDRASVQEAVLQRDPIELETALIARGMIAARLRSLDEWDEQPHAAASAGLPLITVERLGDAPPRDPERRRRVLDCSRVLAGPIAGQTYAAHGADVLRVGSEHLPSVEIGVLTTGSGKRNAFVELGTLDGRTTIRGLLDEADVWIDAYRPGAFAEHGFALGALAPGSVAVQLCAFDWVGPWAGRRGFDSIVQTTTGIAHAGATAAGVSQPTPLPVQALDYCTGLLGVFAAERLVQHQAEVGGTWLARLSLLRTRNWLVDMGGPEPFIPHKPEPESDALHTTTTPFGEVTIAKPLAGRWPHGPQPLGSSAPSWLA